MQRFQARRINSAPRGRVPREALLPHHTSAPVQVFVANIVGASSGNRLTIASLPTNRKSPCDADRHQFHSGGAHPEYGLRFVSNLHVQSKVRSVFLRRTSQQLGAEVAGSAIAFGKIEYTEFCESIIAAGCASYFVSLAGQRAVYYGQATSTSGGFRPRRKL